MPTYVSTKHFTILIIITLPGDACWKDHGIEAASMLVSSITDGGSE